MARTKAADPPKFTSVTLIPPAGCTASLYTSDALRGTSMGTVYVQINLPATPKDRQAVADWLRGVADQVAVAATYSIDGDFEGKDLGVLIAMKQAGMLTPEQVTKLDVKLEKQNKQSKVDAAIEKLSGDDDDDDVPPRTRSGIVDDILGS